tara:strand:+ start:5278 stop:5730 length:453 start_codon:yes stop_codon:yes gene_type:complete
MSETWITRPSLARVYRRSSWKNGRFKHPRTKRIPNYKITIESPDGFESYDIDGGAPILDNLEDQGFDMPYLCRVGMCGTCVSKMLRGRIEQRTAGILSKSDRLEGYILPCISHATGDCVIKTHDAGKFSFNSGEYDYITYPSTPDDTDSY